MEELTITIVGDQRKKLQDEVEAEIARFDPGGSWRLASVSYDAEPIDVEQYLWTARFVYAREQEDLRIAAEQKER